MSGRNEKLLLRLPFLALLLVLAIVLLVLPGVDGYFSEAVANFPFSKYLVGANALNDFNGVGIFEDLYKALILSVLTALTAKPIYLVTQLFSIVDILGNEEETKKARKSWLFRIASFFVEVTAWIISVILLYFICKGLKVITAGAGAGSLMVEVTLFVVCLAGYIAYHIFRLKAAGDVAIKVVTMEVFAEIVDIYIKGSLFILAFNAVRYSPDTAVLVVFGCCLAWMTIGIALEWCKEQLKAAGVKADINYRGMIRAFLALMCAYISALLCRVLMMEGYPMTDAQGVVHDFFNNRLPFIKPLVSGMSVIKSMAADFWGFIPSVIQLFFLSVLMGLSARIFKTPSFLPRKGSGENGAARIIINVIIAFYMVVLLIAVPLLIYLLILIFSVPYAHIFYYAALFFAVILVIGSFVNPGIKGLVIQSGICTLAFMILLDVLNGVPGWFAYVNANPVVLSVISLAGFAGISLLSE